MFVAVRRARAIVESIGLTPEHVGIPLASAIHTPVTLRETLSVFLRAGSSFKAAAEELHLHSNSVKYRVHRAIERRGRPISDGRLDVEVALLMCHWYGKAVLTLAD